MKSSKLNISNEIQKQSTYLTHNKSERWRKIWSNHFSSNHKNTTLLIWILRFILLNYSLRYFHSIIIDVLQQIIRTNKLINFLTQIEYTINIISIYFKYIRLKPIGIFLAILFQTYERTFPKADIYFLIYICIRVDVNIFNNNGTT